MPAHSSPGRGFNEANIFGPGAKRPGRVLCRKGGADPRVYRELHLRWYVKDASSATTSWTFLGVPLSGRSLLRPRRIAPGTGLPTDQARPATHRPWTDHWGKEGWRPDLTARAMPVPELPCVRQTLVVRDLTVSCDKTLHCGCGRRRCTASGRGRGGRRSLPSGVRLTGGEN